MSKITSEKETRGKRYLTMSGNILHDRSGREYDGISVKNLFQNRPLFLFPRTIAPLGVFLSCDSLLPNITFDFHELTAKIAADIAEYPKIVDGVSRLRRSRKSRGYLDVFHRQIIDNADI